MKVFVTIPYQASIQLENDTLEAVGSRGLLNKLSDLIKTQGPDPKLWNVLQPEGMSENILINELIQKAQQKLWVYPHEELCHCRMVKTETVCHAIKSGCRSIVDVSRTTLAGTGCGSCRKEIETLIHQLTD